MAVLLDVIDEQEMMREIGPASGRHERRGPDGSRWLQSRRRRWRLDGAHPSVGSAGLQPERRDLAGGEPELSLGSGSLRPSHQSTSTPAIRKRSAKVNAASSLRPLTCGFQLGLLTR